MKKYISATFDDIEEVEPEEMDLPDREDIKKLKGHNDLLWLQVGNYQIVYTVDNVQCIVLVIDTGNRGEIYNKY